MSRPSEYRRWRTAIMGFGKIAAGYTEDPLTAKYFPYSTHAQVLKEHPSFDWLAVVDPSDDAERNARERWDIPIVVPTLKELLRVLQPEVLVIATPPERRDFSLDDIPGLRAVVVEKPLGIDCEVSQKFVEMCRDRGILLQVNLWRRADSLFRRLAAGELKSRIGALQAASVVYGNGLRNNGTHLVDFVRMVLGEVVAIQSFAGSSIEPAGPISGDLQFPFAIRLESGISVMFQPLRFEHYRENGLDVWGEDGRLSIMLEGLSVTVCQRNKNRALSDAFEIASDRPEALKTTAGKALYKLYDNLASALSGSDVLWSTGESALKTTQVVEGVIHSFQQGGRVITL